MTLVSKTLKFKPQGMIQSGEASYSINPSIGEINYAANVELEYFFSTHEHQTKGQYKVDPKLLVSKNLVEGQSIVFGPVSIVVTAVEGNHAQANIEILGYAKGVAELSLAKPTLEIMNIKLSGAVFGMSFQLEAE